jgi:hypothetical protein
MFLMKTYCLKLSNRSTQIGRLSNKRQPQKQQVPKDNYLLSNQKEVPHKAYMTKLKTYKKVFGTSSVWTLV